MGGAGINVLDRLAHDGARHEDLVAVNTDLQSLTGSVAGKKIQLGKRVTRGLGAGGDPELGYAAAEEALDEIREALGNAGVVFLCMGLGGGTGSGAAPLIVQTAREAGAFVVVFATMPFQFEGRRRMQQAEEALAAIQQRAHAVICFENDRMGEALSPQAGIHEAFSNADRTVSESLLAMMGMVNRESLIQLGFDEVLSVLKQPNARCLFGYGVSDSEERAREALEAALRNPLMDRGRLLGESTSLIVQITGGPSMTLYEVETLMEEIGKLAGDKTQIMFGLGVDPQMGDQMSVMLFSSVAPWRTESPRLADDDSVARQSPPQRAAFTRPAITTQAGHSPRSQQPNKVEAEDNNRETAVTKFQVKHDAPPEKEEEIHRKPAFVSLATGHASKAQAEQNIQQTAPEPAQQPMSTLARITQRVQASMGIARSANPQAHKTDTSSGAATVPGAPSPRRYTPQKTERQRDPFAADVVRNDAAQRESEIHVAQGRESESRSADEPHFREQAKDQARDRDNESARRLEMPARRPGESISDTHDEQKQTTDERSAADLLRCESARRNQEPLIGQRPSQEEEGGLPVRSTRIVPVRPQARVVSPRTAIASGAASGTGDTPRQEMLQFDPVNRGRFEKSEPTIVDGQDLDVPTFMRQNPKASG